MSDWSGQKVLMIGAARQGLALARYLVQHGAQVVLNDQRSEQQMQTTMHTLQDLPIQWVLGGHPLDVLDGVDLVCISGGVPLDLPIILEAQRRGLPVSNDSEIFMAETPCQTIGITGSAGKTTTTTLVGRMAQAGITPPRRVWVGGNIGQPLISSVAEMQPEDLVVAEFSSFQLELMTSSPQIAAVLNITPNHLDRHGTMEAYTAAKRRLVAFQDQQGVAVLNREDPGSWSLAGQISGQLVTFGIGKPPSSLAGTYVEGDQLFLQQDGSSIELMSRSTLQLRGEHNLYNVLAACAIAHAAGLPVEAMVAGVSGFTGVPHRLEFVRSWGGADWYNDSIATAPERSMAAIHSFTEPLVLLAGGRDKNLPWEKFADLVHERVDHLVVFGEAAEVILKAIGPQQPGQRPYSLSRCEGLQSAVLAAARVVQPGDIVLLSPGGTSYDEFRDFEERGEWFQKWVKELP